MTYGSRGLFLFVGVAAFLSFQMQASASWNFTVSGRGVPLSSSTSIQKYNMAGASTGSAGTIDSSLLREHPNHPDVYYAAHVYGEVHVGPTSKSGGTSVSISGDKEWRWTWVVEDGKIADDYIWDYSVKGKAYADVQIKIDDNGGYGKAEAHAWVKLEASAVNIPARSESVAVVAGAEVREDGGALTGVGFEAGTTGGGLSLDWEWGGVQLYAGQTITQYVTLSDVKRPGSVCWVKIHTSGSGTMGAFHDTYQYSNDCTAGAGIVYHGYSLHKLQEPFYSPE